MNIEFNKFPDADGKCFTCKKELTGMFKVGTVSNNFNDNVFYLYEHLKCSFNNKETIIQEAMKKYEEKFPNE